MTEGFIFSLFHIGVKMTPVEFFSKTTIIHMKSLNRNR